MKKLLLILLLLLFSCGTQYAFIAGSKKEMELKVKELQKEGYTKIKVYQMSNPMYYEIKYKDP